MQFFKISCETIKGDLLKLYEDFYAERANLERINWPSISLILKVQTPEAQGDYRPISLINSSLKIVFIQNLFQNLSLLFK